MLSLGTSSTADAVPLLLQEKARRVQVFLKQALVIGPEFCVEDVFCFDCFLLAPHPPLTRSLFSYRRRRGGVCFPCDNARLSPNSRRFFQLVAVGFHIHKRGISPPIIKQKPQKINRRFWRPPFLLRTTPPLSPPSPTGEGVSQRLTDEAPLTPPLLPAFSGERKCQPKG